MNEHQRAYVQVVFCRPASGIDDDRVLRVSAQIQPILDAHPAFLAREVSKTPDGRWIDQLWWTDRDGANDAARAVHEGPLGKEMDALFEPQSVEIVEFDSLWSKRKSQGA